MEVTEQHKESNLTNNTPTDTKSDVNTSNEFIKGGRSFSKNSSVLPSPILLVSNSDKDIAALAESFSHTNDLADDPSPRASLANKTYKSKRDHLADSLQSSQGIVHNILDCISCSTVTEAIHNSAHYLEVPYDGMVLDDEAILRIKNFIPTYVNSIILGDSEQNFNNENKSQQISNSNTDLESLKFHILELEPIKCLQKEQKVPSIFRDISIPQSRAVARDKFRKSLKSSLSHLDKLLLRINDTKSRVLVTGDLNAGKSTFVNAILGRQVVPEDQEPCTALFAEVLSADKNDGVEEVHGVKDINNYNNKNPSTFTRFDFRHLRHVIEDNPDDFQEVYIYCNDSRSNSRSLLHNGIADLSLIDSPGLNIDYMKTTALFSQQEEIDVVVFVVNAENHFTMTGVDFLKAVGKEKGYIFIVVNRFDSIRKKDRCKTEILNQIKEISPKTFYNSDSLVHFVSAREYQSYDMKKRSEVGTSTDETDSSSSTKDIQPYVKEFEKLERDLRDFVLKKRERSKLEPAKLYISYLLRDILYILEYNMIVSEKAINHHIALLKSGEDGYSQLLKSKEDVFDVFDGQISETITDIEPVITQMLEEYFDNLEKYASEVEFYLSSDFTSNLINYLYHCAAMHIQEADMIIHGKISSVFDKLQEEYRLCVDNHRRLLDNFNRGFNPDSSYTEVDNADYDDHQISTIDFGYESVSERSKSVNYYHDAHTIPNQDFINPTTDAILDNSVFSKEELKLLVNNDARSEIFIASAPGIFMTVSGWLGFKFFSMKPSFLIQNVRGGQINPKLSTFSSDSGKLWKILCAAVGVAGIYTIFYVFSDLRNILENVTIKRIKTQLHSTGYVDKSVRKLTNSALKEMHEMSSQTRAEFRKLLTTEENRRHRHAEKVRKAGAGQSLFSKLSKQIENILDHISNIKFDLED